MIPVKRKLLGVVPNSEIHSGQQQKTRNYVNDRTNKNT